MASKQRGITLMSFILVLIVIGLLAVVAMNLFPVYSEGFSVQSAMKSVAQEPNAANMSLPEAQKKLQKHFDIDYVDSVKGKDAKIERDKGVNNLVMTYEVRKHLFYNIDFVAMFDYRVDMSGGGASAQGE
jgi:Tfp pilus assembly protein PilE